VVTTDMTFGPGSDGNPGRSSILEIVEDPRNHGTESVMQTFNAAFPILPGKTEQARKNAAELMGDKRADYEDGLKRTGIGRETWTLQSTPMGDFMLVWFEAEDIEEVFTILATSTEPFDVWFREQVLDTNGIDLSAPMEGPPPEPMGDWRA
jgi:hypothetical protein